MKSKEVKRKEAIARNSLHIDKYVKQAQEAEILDPEKAKAFVDHKIGIPKEKKRS